MKIITFLLNGLRKIRDNIRSITESQNKFYSVIVLASGFALALGLCLTFRPKFDFYYNGEIVSWITANKYPKQQELYYYILSLILIPSISVLIWLGWILWSRFISFLTKLPLCYTLKKYSLTYLPFFMILTRLSEPKFAKMLLIPIVLFASTNIIFFCYDLLKTRLKFIAKNLFCKDLIERHWCIFASGVCIGLFILINYSDTPQKLLSCLKIIGISVASAWLFWIICGFILILITKRQFKKNLLMLAYSHISLILLLPIALLFEHGNTLIIIALICMFLTKVIIIAKPSWIEKLDSRNYNKRLLNYVMIPAIIYVIFYSGGNIHSGIDIFHEGERIAPLNSALRGEIPYRDVYLQHGLFYNYYRPLLASKLFGASLASDRLLGHILDPLGFVGFYLLALQILRSRLSIFLLLWILSSGVSEEFVFWNASRRMVYTPGRLSFGYFSLAMIAFYINQVSKSPLIPLYERRKVLAPNLKKRIFNHISIIPAIAGIFSMLTIFYSLEIGLYTTVACMLFLMVFVFSPQSSIEPFIPFFQKVKDRFRPLLSYILGLFVVFIPISIYLAIYGAFDDMLSNSYIQTRYQGIIWGLRFPPLFPELAKIKSIETMKAFILSETFKWYMPVLVYLISLTFLAYQFIRFRLWKVKSNISLMFITIAGIVFFRTMLGRSDGTHLYGMAFAWIIGMFLIESLFIRIWKDLKMDFGVSMSWHSQKPISTLSNPFSVIAWRAIAIIFLVWYAISVYNPIDSAKNLSAILTGYGNFDRYNIDPPLERIGAIRISADQASQIKAVVNYIQSNTKPDETIFDFSNQGGYYFFADRPSATRYHQVCYASIDKMQNEVIRDLEEKRTKLIIFSNSSWMDSIDGVSSFDRHKIIANYIKEKYAESAKIGTTTIYMRK